MTIRYQIITATGEGELEESTFLEVGQILAENSATLIGSDEGENEIIWNFEVDPGMNMSDDSMTGIDVFIPIAE